MFLRDFYEQSDINNRRRRVIMCLVILALFTYVALVIVTCPNQLTQEEIEQIISKSATLRQLDRFCSEIPKPKDFSYKYKKLTGNSITSNITYGYKTDLRFSEVRDFYISYFEKEGWTQESLWENEQSALPRLLEYRKGKHTVSLELGTFSEANYSFDCDLDR